MEIARSSKLPVNSPTLRENALMIFDSLLITEQESLSKEALERFSAMPSWISGFVSRHALRSVQIHGMAGAVQIANVASGIAELRDARYGYNPELIFNMNETGLVYKYSQNGHIIYQVKIKELLGV